MRQKGTARPINRGQKGTARPSNRGQKGTARPSNRKKNCQSNDSYHQSFCVGLPNTTAFPVPSYWQKQCKAKVSQGQEATVQVCYLPRQLAPPHTAIYYSTPVLSAHLAVTVTERRPALRTRQLATPRAPMYYSTPVPVTHLGVMVIEGEALVHV